MSPRVLTFVILVSSWSHAAFADDARAADALLREGASLFKHENYEGARTAFARAYALEPRPGLLFDLALSELNADHPVEAVGHLHEYLTHTDEPAAKLVSVRTKWLPRAEGRTARLDVFAPAGAQVFVDGAKQDPAPPRPDATTSPLASIVIAAGEHDVNTVQGATTSEAQHVSARGGELVELHFQQVPDAPAPTAPIAWAAPLDSRAPEGEGTSRSKTIVVLVLGAGAIVAAGVGVGFGLAAKSQANDAEYAHDAFARGASWTPAACTGASASSPACAELESAVHANRLDWTLSVVSYVGAGVLGAASLATWLWWKPKSLAITARPTIDARTAGVVLDGPW